MTEEASDCAKCRRMAENRHSRILGACLFPAAYYIWLNTCIRRPRPVDENGGFCGFLPEKLDGTEKSGNHHLGRRWIGTADRENMSTMLLRQHCRAAYSLSVVNQDLIVIPLGQER
ncbi:MAG: hypothetical protein QHC90_13465 [Shinella sp.]|nr:hypothetical protein [Shinella sp.]